jgi:hypothetical protein
MRLKPAPEGDLGLSPKGWRFTRLRKWSQSPAAIGDGRSGPCSQNGERITDNRLAADRMQLAGNPRTMRLALDVVYLNVLVGMIRKMCRVVMIHLDHAGEIGARV